MDGIVYQNESVALVSALRSTVRSMTVSMSGW
jgi:hypothetical protein